MSNKKEKLIELIAKNSIMHDELLWECLEKYNKNNTQKIAYSELLEFAKEKELDIPSDLLTAEE